MKLIPFYKKNTKALIVILIVIIFFFSFINSSRDLESFIY